MSLAIDPGQDGKVLSTSVAGLPLAQLTLGGGPPPAAGGYSFFDANGDGTFAVRVPVPAKAPWLTWAGGDLLVKVEFGHDRVGAGPADLDTRQLTLMPPGARLDDADGVTLDVSDPTVATLKLEGATFVCLSDLGIDSGGACDLGDNPPLSIEVDWVLDDTVQNTTTGGPLCE